MDKALNQLEKTAIPSSVVHVMFFPLLLLLTCVGFQTTEKPLHEMTRLIQVILGLAPPSENVPIENLTLFDESLNASQKEAVKFALESAEVACPVGRLVYSLHGSYLSLRSWFSRIGTGKTRTPIEIIRQLTVATIESKPQRLLVCGASNLSVDNILERLLALSPSARGEGLRATRIGHPARVMANESVLDSTLEAKAARSDQVRGSIALPNHPLFFNGH